MKKQKSKSILTPKWRALIGAVLTILIGVSSSTLGSWNNNQKFFTLKILLFIILSVSDIILITYSSVQEAKEKSLSLELRSENSALKKALAGIIMISQYNSSEINKYIWNYKKACYNLCATIFNFVAEISHDQNVEVSYVKLDESVPGQVELYAYENQNDQKPNLLNVKRNFSNQDTIQYYDMALFFQNKSDTKVLYGSNEINTHFYRTPEARRNHPDKYNQYIGIPVFCDNRKMIGLLQIACLKGCSLAEDKQVLEEVANKYFVPYANLFLLLHKMNKALLLGIK